MWRKEWRFWGVIFVTWTFSYLALLLKCDKTAAKKVAIWGKMMVTWTFSYLASLLKMLRKSREKSSDLGENVSDTDF